MTVIDARAFHHENHWSKVRFEQCAMKPCVEWNCHGHLMKPGPAHEHLRQRDGDQSLPTSNDRPSAHDGVVADVLSRKEFGLRRYGSILQPFNGRDGIRDAYEEVLDAAAYLRREMDERLVVARVVLWLSTHNHPMPYESDVDAVFAWAKRTVDG